MLRDRRVYVDTRLHTLLDIPFNKPFFARGQFPSVISNGTGLVALPNPWVNGTKATPFDQGALRPSSAGPSARARAADAMQRFTSS